MDAINLTETTRTNLLAIQNAAHVREQSARQLSTGLKVERATDNAVSYFQARGLTNRVSDLFNVKNDIGQALSAVESSLGGVKALGDISQQLRGIALSARGGSSDQRAAAAGQYDALRNQLANLANDTSYQGTNLVGSTPDNLTTNLNESGSASTTIQGSASDASGLGVQSASGAFGSFATDAGIDAAVAQIESAISQLRSTSSGFGSDIGLLNIRETFTSNLNATLQEGAAKLVNADLNEAAAVQLSGQIKQQLGTNTLLLAAQGEQLVGQLLFS